MSCTLSRRTDVLKPSRWRKVGKFHVLENDPMTDILARTPLDEKLGCNISARTVHPARRAEGPAYSPPRRAAHSLHYGDLKLRERCGDHPEAVMVAIQGAGIGVGLFAFLWCSLTLLSAMTGVR